MRVVSSCGICVIELRLGGSSPLGLAEVREGFVVFSDSALYGAIFQTQRFKTSP